MSGLERPKRSQAEWTRHDDRYFNFYARWDMLMSLVRRPRSTGAGGRGR